MNKLTYTKFANDSIKIDLLNGYTVIAMKLFDYKTKKYEVSFYIKDNTVNFLDLIEKQKNVSFNNNYKTINAAILKYVATLLSAGFFDYYVQRYAYMMKCFDKGHDTLQKEESGDN